MPLAQTLVPQVGAPDPADDGHPDGVVLGMQAHDPVAHEHQGPEVGRFLAVAPQDVAADRLDLGLRKGDFHLHDVAGIEQAPDMLLQAEDGGAAVLTMVGPDALEDSQAVMQGMGQDVNLGLIPGNEFAVQPDELRLLHHLSYPPESILLKIFIVSQRTCQTVFPPVFIALSALFRYDGAWH